MKQVGDWRKGGIWDKATIYRYGSTDTGDFCHLLCFYKSNLICWEKVVNTEWEFEVTQVLDSPDMLCMLYPFVDKAALLDQLKAWFENSVDSSDALWAACATYAYGPRVNFFWRVNK